MTDPLLLPASLPGLTPLLLRDPRRTVLVRVRGESMRAAGIHPDDLLVVERRRRAATGQLVVALVGGGLTLKRLERRRDGWWLLAAHPDYPPLTLAGGRVWGVAVQRIRHLQPRTEGAPR
jgi:DNA polymerase V